MSIDKDKIVSLKLKLKSVSKSKLSSEREARKLRYKERCISEELCSINAEIELLKDELEGLQVQLSTAEHQISMIEVCLVSEKSKFETQSSVLNQHLEGFQQLFLKEQYEHELRMKEKREREAEQQEVVRQKEREVAEKNECLTKEAAAIDAESEAIERECAVLKKRNNAIMLKLRKKLLETENARRELIKRNTKDAIEKDSTSQVISIEYDRF